MRRVRCVATIGPPQRDDVDGRLLRLHGPDLRRRRLGSEHCRLVDEERRERRARRVTGREVERVEVVVGRLDLAAVDDAVPEAEEDVLHLPPDLGDQVQPPARIATGRERHVGALGRQPGVELRPRELLLATVDGRLEPLADGVQRHSGLAVAHLAERLLDRALAPQVLDANRLDLVRRGCGRCGGESFALECVGIHEGSSVPTRPPRNASLHCRCGALRLHRRDLRPVERLGRRGHRVLRRGGEASATGPSSSWPSGRGGSPFPSRRRGAP